MNSKPQFAGSACTVTGLEVANKNSQNVSPRRSDHSQYDYYVMEIVKVMSCLHKPHPLRELTDITLDIVYVLLGISPASNCSWPTFRNPVSVPSSKAGCRL